MTRTRSVLDRLRKICLALPDTKETLTWGKPHFRVGEKIFAGCGEEQGKATIGFKLEMDHADAIVQDPRFWRAPYVGHRGWVSVDASRIRDWRELQSLIYESYRLIAPKRSLAKLTGGTQEASRSSARAEGTRGRSRATAREPRTHKPRAASRRRRR
jgi:predicted DNA-binding protein (MmcQ/YjbR family)